MKIKYWTSFSKRKNSTKQPTGGTEVTVTLKEPCSMLAPVFRCATAAIKDATYIEAFNRYYFVNEVTFDGPHVLVSCVSDPMATFKTAIGSTYANVEYTSASNSNDITDPRNRPTIVVDQTGDILYDLLGMGFLNGYRYVVGIISDDGVNYYLLEKAQLDALVKDLFGNDFVQHMTSEFYDLKSCLVSCVAVPINRDSSLYDNEPIKIGGHNISSTSETWSKIKDSKRILKHTVALTAMDFPSDDLGYDFSYLDVAPYTIGSLYLPFVGVVPLDMDIFAQNKAISITIACDICTGDIVYTLHRTSNGDKIATYQGNCGANIPIAGQSYNAIGVAGSALGIIGGAATGIIGMATENPAVGLGGLGAMTGAAMSTVQSMERHTQLNGSLSTMVGLSLGLNIEYIIQTRRPAEPAIDSAYKAVSGMPYFKGDTIGNLSGFVKCAGASISISGYDEDRTIINDYLNGGFYYE